jgi:hypothetical protein
VKWFRLYHEVLDDPKILKLNPRLFRMWVKLLCLASQENRDGILPDLDTIALRLRLDRASARRGAGALENAGLLTRGADGALRPHNWANRQYASDDVTARTKKHKRKSYDKSQNHEPAKESIDGERSQDRSGNVSGTAPDYRYRLQIVAAQQARACAREDTNQISPSDRRPKNRESRAQRRQRELDAQCDELHAEEQRRAKAEAKEADDAAR